MASSSGVRVPSHYRFVPPYVEKELLTAYKAKMDKSSPNLFCRILYLMLAQPQYAFALSTFPLAVPIMATSLGAALYSEEDKFLGRTVGLIEKLFTETLGGAALPDLGRISSKESPIEVYDMHDEDHPSLLRSRKTSVSSADAQANICFDNLCEIDSYFRTVVSVVPVKASRELMRANIHCPWVWNNACWVPQREAVFFGEVDHEVFKPLVESLEVTTHEFGHAVTYYSSNLTYNCQSGALNESMSDVFAIMHKHHKVGSKADNPATSWLIGEGIVVGAKEGSSLRSMNRPGTAYKDHDIIGSDPQPKDMAGYVVTSEDNGGVHINSSIPNRAFYLAASTIGGGSWETAGKVWSRTLLESKTDDDFSAFAGRTCSVAKELRCGEPVINLVGKAWTDVGVEPKV